MNFAWKALILIIAGILLLRLSGRKSISQMTVPQTVVMISIGQIIVQPIVETKVWRAIGGAAIFIAVLIVTELLQVHFNFFENLITGKAKVVIEDGIIKEKELKKLRFTVDQLEMRLRQNGITNIEDVKTATLEPNGLIGYELFRRAKPVTIGDLEKMLANIVIIQNQDSSYNLFDEVKNNKHLKDNKKLE